MDWRVFLSTFVMIFLAELGDKTQLAVISQTASSGGRWGIFFAASLALVLSTALGVLAGCVLRRFVPNDAYIKIAAGLVFLVFGVLMVKEGIVHFRDPAPKPECETIAKDPA